MHFAIAILKTPLRYFREKLDFGLCKIQENYFKVFRMDLL